MGGSSCKTCTHPERNTIDTALVDGLTLAEIGRRYGMSKPALMRHRDNHLAHRVEAAVAERAEQLAASTGRIIDRLARLADEAEVYALTRMRAGAPNAPQAVREARETLVRIGEVRREFVTEGYEREATLLEQLVGELREERDAAKERTS